MNCARFQARLVDLQELGSGEQTDLERHAETCSGCKAKLEGYRGLMAALRTLGAPLHIDGERLTRFAIYRAAPSEPDYDQERLSGKELREIEGHVSECPRCRLAVDSIVSQYVEMDRFLADAGVLPVPIDRPSLWVSVKDALERAASRAKNVLIYPPSYPAGVALGALVVAGILWMGPWLRDPYHELTYVEANEISFLTRDASNGSSALADGISLMNQGRYSEAITLLEQVTRDESDDRLENYAHYLSGLAWIYEAKTEVLGRVLAYNEMRLDRAIEHLETVAESSSSGRVREDSYWLLGKAHLMKQDPTSAVKAFTEVEHIDGRRSGEARKLIDAIEEIG
jgi:tetratricopeptide (TPR) repeat protein